LIAFADRLVERIEQSGYRLSLGNDEFYWGSNSVALGYAFELVQAYEFSGMLSYKWTALDQLHYILGRNPFGISYVTGVGYNSARNPYHQFSIRLNHREPVPGMVVGGPNSSSRLDGRKLSEYPAKAYEDREKNYMVNETAINYTAPFIYLAGYFSDFRYDITIPEIADMPLIKTDIHKN
jgi:endoglucanase